jgi:hypothetical protein
MMKSMIRSMLLGLVFAVVSMPLFAQESGANAAKEKTVAKVETDGGVIMISDGAEFATALPEQRVRSKARLMVSEESAARVVYDDGCEQKYDKPGVYEISATCVLPVAFVGGGGPSTALLVGGSLVSGAVLGAVIQNNRQNCRCPPVSR